MKRSQHAENQKAQPAAKKTKLSDQQGSSSEILDSATRQFFNTPELVHMITLWLAKDRVDLLQLAATCKSFRVHALQTWATYLDVPLSMAEKRLELFQANPGLSRHVRYLRFYDDIVHSALHGERHPQFEDHDHLWAKISALLDLIATEPSPELHPPFLDLSIGCQDIQRLSAVLRSQSRIKLLKKMVALQVIECMCIPPDIAHCLYYPDYVLPMIFPNALIDLIAQAQQAAIVSNSPGLRLFGYRSNPKNRIGSASRAFWTAFSNATSQTLQELFIDSYYPTEGTVLPGISFPSLKQCELKVAGTGQHADIQNFLNRHLTLEHLSITQARDSPHPTHINLPQTFPSLRSLTLKRAIIDSNTALRDFAVRHPQLERLKVTNKHSAFSSGEGRREDASYPLAQSLKSQSSPDPVFFDDVASQGGSVAHVELLEVDSSCTSTLGEFMSTSWLTKAQNAQAARAVTCLKLVLSNTSLFTYMVDLDKAFESSNLPNLTELYLSLGKTELEEKHFRTLLTQLCTATSLRILRLDASVRGSLRESPDIFFGHTFPAALDYVSVHAWNERDLHFRYIGDPHAPTSLGKQGLGKKGRLQRVSSFAHIIVSPEGVWSEPSAAWRAGTFLNHMDGDKCKQTLTW